MSCYHLREYSHIVTACKNNFVFLTYRFVFESTSWLLVTGKFDRAVTNVKSIAMNNGVKLSKEDSRQLEVICINFCVID